MGPIPHVMFQILGILLLFANIILSEMWILVILHLANKVTSMITGEDEHI